MTNNAFEPAFISPRQITGVRADRVGFDREMQRFLSSWAFCENRALLLRRQAPRISFGTYIQTEALADYFKLTPNPMASLLVRSEFKEYLTRPLSSVDFCGDAHEPRFSRFEQRIYNLAARQSIHVPFRYEINKRQTCFGDSIAPNETVKTDGITPYFGTRRADIVVETLMQEYLKIDALRQTPALTVEIANRPGHSIYEALQLALAQPPANGSTPRCIIVQGRQGFIDDKPRLDPHFGVVLAIVSDAPQGKLLRLMVFDSQETENRQAVYTPNFLFGLGRIASSGFSDQLASNGFEDGSVKLIRPGTPKVWRSFDIDCSFYSFAMAKALVKVACERPDVLLLDRASDVRNEMMTRMPEFCNGPGSIKSSHQIREATLNMRWKMGQEALSRLTPISTPEVELTELLKQGVLNPIKTLADDLTV